MAATAGGIVIDRRGAGSREEQLRADLAAIVAARRGVTGHILPLPITTRSDSLPIPGVDR